MLLTNPFCADSVNAMQYHPVHRERRGFAIFAMNDSGYTPKVNLR